MNKRQAKKRRKIEEEQLSIWGYLMTYREQREAERNYHEYIVSIECRSTSDNSDDLEYRELANILGITYEKQEYKYKYPNRFRMRNFHKAVMKRQYEF